MNKTLFALVVAASLWASGASAMTVREFLATADRIPRNPAALLRSDTRLLMNELKTAFQSVRAEQASARAAGRRPATCIPEGKISKSPDAVIERLNAIPAQRRSISVTQAVREWMAEEHPCPS